VLVIGPPAIAGIVTRGRDAGDPGRVRPFAYAALAGVVAAGLIHVASLDVDGMAVLGYGYAILASLAGAVVAGLIGLRRWVASRHGSDSQ